LTLIKLSTNIWKSLGVDMTEQERVPVESLGAFIGRVDESLSHARQPEVTFAQAHEIASTVLSHLTAVEQGRLALHPEMSDAQLAIYKNNAQTVIDMGRKSIASVEQTAQQRRFGTRNLAKSTPKTPKAPKQAKPKRTYSGRGSAAK
jgi:hypothetical protein